MCLKASHMSLAFLFNEGREHISHKQQIAWSFASQLLESMATSSKQVVEEMVG